jgi:Transposase DDE domain
VVLCRQFNLFTRAVVALDGSRFKAVNNRDKNFTVAKVAKRIAQVEASIARYLTALDRADRRDDDVAEARTVRLTEKIEGLRRQMQSLKAMGEQVEASPDKQVSLTDPDARSMATSGKGTGVVGYNVQMAVDAEHHLIVAHEVTNIGSDRSQLTSMGHKAQEATGCDELTVLADRGYFNGDQVLACEGTGVLPIIPKTQTSNNPNRGLFSGADFIYDVEHDHYTCPAGQHLTKGKVRSDRRDDMDHYRNLSACEACVLNSRCTTDKHKRVKRWLHEGVLDKMQARLDRLPEAMAIRRQTVEHPFGTLKAWMGSTHFLTKTLDKVRTEMSLQVLAYNMKRMISIFGVKRLMQAIAA